VKHAKGGEGPDVQEKRKVSADEHVAAEVAAEETPQKAENSPRAFLGSLWEQWGLLGLLVGLAFAFGPLGLGASLGASFGGLGDLGATFGRILLSLVNGVTSGDFSDLGDIEGVQSVGDALGALGGGVDALSALGGLGATVLGGLVGMQNSVDGAAQESLSTAAETAATALAGAEVLADGAAAEAVTLASEAELELPGLGAELELEEGFSALELGQIAGGVGFAGAVSATSGLAGLVTEGLKSEKLEEGTASFLTISSATPGTIRKSGRRIKDYDPVLDAEDKTVPKSAAEGDRPTSALELGAQNFRREWKQLLKAAATGNRVSRKKIPSFVPLLKLSNQAVVDRELARPQVPTPLPVKIAYDVLCQFIDVVFEDRPIQRFWFLETVARMPYFSYASVLHLYETLGWWRSPELRAVHAAEEDNELHHLLIMESLGGDQRWLDRFFAQHGAIAYYWILIGFFIIDPRWSYNFSRLIEAHAVDTYGEFRDANEELLKSLPPPPVAIEYYRGPDFYLFDKFQTALNAEGKIRRPPCSTLHDVFSNICDDEGQHVATMEACEEWVAGGEAAVPLGFNRLSVEEYKREVTRTDEGREAWVKWGEEVAAAAREAGRQVD